MTATTTPPPLSVIGVPEHFNLAWYALAEEGLIEWTDVAEGTGAMLEMLQNGDADVALTLTDGAVAGIAKGIPVQVSGCYVESALVWGVHVAANSASHKPGDIVGQRFAISRYGSGSHLMANVYAQSRQWPDESLEYVVVNTLTGARHALPSGDAEIFLWEVFTTKPYVEAGEFRRIDAIPTPWPAFVACVHRDASATTKARTSDILTAALARAAALRKAPNAENTFAKRFGLKPDDAREWLKQTRWSQDGAISDATIAQTAQVLQQADILTVDQVASLNHWRA
ncbi:MAG: ABC transporter substrate-binding protein [Pseudomonadota bacterium]